MAQSVTITVSTAATTQTLGTLILNPVSKSTTVLWTATSGSSAYALVEMAIFIGLLLLAYVYAWRKQALEWI